MSASRLPSTLPATTRRAALGTLATLAGLVSALTALGQAPQPAAPGSAASAGGPTLAVVGNPAAGSTDIVYGNRVLLQYATPAAGYKPYVKEFRTLKGVNLLLDSPSDHVHHHGLMYAITVNGVNFWEESKDPGTQLPILPPRHQTGRLADGRPFASLSHQTFWLAHTNRAAADPAAAALLLETRTLTLAVDAPRGEVALSWRSDFTVGKAAPEVKLGGAGYHGLGMRFVRDLDLKARHLNSEGAAYSAEQTWDVIPARWAATQGRVADQDVMSAIFAAPKNAGPSRFFSMIKAFAYVSATQGLDEAPLTHRAGDRFRLEYLVLNRDGAADAAALEARYRAWLTELGTATH